MLIRECSDLHPEGWDFNKFDKRVEMALPSLDTDKDTVLLLAGDCGTMNHYKSTYKPLFAILSERFREVIVTYGNHNWYNGRFWGWEKYFWTANPLPKNVTILENDYKTIDDVVFIGSTLWTDFNNDDFNAKHAAQMGMNDYHLCWKEAAEYSPYSQPGLRLSPNDTLDAHIKAKAFIFEAIEMFRKYYKTVVLTHHLPSSQSVHDRYEGDLLNYSYFSELSEEICLFEPDFWFHGHTHDSFDYMINKTRVICNPYGYLFRGSQTNEEYNSRFLLEI